MFSFHLTITGFIYTVFSFLLLAGAAFRGELFAIVCGVCLVLYLLLSLAVIIISFFLWRKTNFLLNLKNGKISISSLQEKNGKTLFPLILPGVFVFYVFDFFADLNDKKSRNLKLNIRLQRNKTFFVLPKKNRGCFFWEKEYVELSDIAGLFSVRLFKKEKSFPKIFIHPILGEEKLAVLPEVLNETSDHRTNIRRTDELYDTRPYIIGDDTRKINWKLYAHTSELAVRQGDFIPPPHNFFTIYIEEPIVSKNFEFFRKQFDEFINVIASIAFDLHKKGLSFNILVYDSEKKELRNNIVYPDDDNAIDLIKNIFSIPQIKIAKKENKIESECRIKKDFFENEENKKTSLLYFFMPINSGQTVLAKLFTNFNEHKHKCVFYTGLQTIIKEPESFLHSFLFYTSAQKKEKRLLKEMNETVKVLNDEMQRQGFYVYSI